LWTVDLEFPVKREASRDKYKPSTNKITNSRIRADIREFVAGFIRGRLGWGRLNHDL